MSDEHEHLQSVSIRLDSKTRAALAAEAARQRRPVGNLVRLVLADWIASRGEFDGRREFRRATNSR